EITGLDAGAADEARRLGRRRSRTVEARKPPFNLVHDRLVVDRAGGRDHHVRSAVVAGGGGGDTRAIERAHRRRGAEDRATDRLPGERGLLQLVPDKIVGSILGGADLLDDDVLLAPQFLGIEGWIR